MTAPKWRDCADPDELAAAVAAGVEVRAMGRAGDFPTANQTADQFAGSLRAGITYRIPTSWSPDYHSDGPTTRARRQAQARRGTTPAPDDLAAHARRHADGHPESRDLIEELLGEAVRGEWMAARLDEADAERTTLRHKLVETMPTTPPDGCEAVFMPTGLVDEWCERVGMTATMDVDTIDACREAQARRGTIPTPEWLTPEVVGRIEDAMLNGDTEDPPPTRTPSSLGDAMRLIGRYTESEGGDSPETTNARRGLFSGYDAWVGAGRPESTTPPPVPPWPGAVLSGLVDEDGEPTWLAQAPNVLGEAVRTCIDFPWFICGSDNAVTPYWVEVRAPRAVPAALVTVTIPAETAHALLRYIEDGDYDTDYVIDRLADLLIAAMDGDR